MMVLNRPSAVGYGEFSFTRSRTCCRQTVGSKQLEWQWRRNVKQQKRPNSWGKYTRFGWEWA